MAYKLLTFDVLCKCGTPFRATRKGLISGNTRSCGCLKRALDRKRCLIMARSNITHGQSRPPTGAYVSWVSMRTRVKNPKIHNYECWGGRGITISGKWDKFENFFRDMGPRPADTSLDRINNDLGYCKENCRWATTSEQSSNRRKVTNNCRCKYCREREAWRDLGK